MILSTDGKIGTFAPQLLGETNPILQNGYWYAETGLTLLGKFHSYSSLYKAQPAVATVVDKIANAAARLPIKAYATDKDGNRTEDESSEYAKLLRQPSRTMSTYSFWRWLFSTYETFGEGYLLKQRDQSGKVVGLEPMHPQRTAVKRLEDGSLVYSFTLGVSSSAGGLLEVPGSEVVPFLRYNPDNTMRGLSRLEPLRVTLQNEDAARRANGAFWKNGARPSVVLSHPGELSQAAMDRLKTNFDSKHSGADNVGGSVVLEEGMTVTPIQLDSEEMQYIESRKLNMQEVCMVYDVPPPVIHILDHATYSNITEQMRSMYRDTMAPRLTDIESVLDFYLRSEFYASADHYAEFDMTDVLRGDFDARATTAAALRTAGVISGNESREIVGLEKSDDPEMAKVYANSAIQELGTKPAAAGGAAAGGDPGHANLPGDPMAHGDGEPDTSVPGDELLSKPKPGMVKNPPPKPPATAEAARAKRSIDGALGRKAYLDALARTLVDQHDKALKPYFEDQRKAVLAALPKARPPIKGVATKDAEGDIAASEHDIQAAEHFFAPEGTPLQNVLGALYDDGDNGDDTETYGWNDRLFALLNTLTQATATAIGKQVSNDLGGEWNPEDVRDLLVADSQKAAKKINRSTADALVRALDQAIIDMEQTDAPDYEAILGLQRKAVDGTYDKIDANRRQQIAESRVKQTALTAEVSAAAAAGVTLKTWIVTSAKPRPGHAMVDGETQPLGEFFSNGMLGPGDIANGGIDEVAGCTCVLDYERPQTVGEDIEAAEAVAADTADGLLDGAKGLGTKYSPDQPREHGRFAPGGGADHEATATLSPEANATLDSIPLFATFKAGQNKAMAAIEAHPGADIARAALANVSIQHGSETLPDGTEVNGSFDPTAGVLTVDSGDGRTADEVAETFAHETGHAIDYTLNPFASAEHPMTASAANFTAPRGTQWGNYWSAVRSNPRFGNTSREYGARLASYAKTPTEVFARTYAQYTGLADGSARGQFGSEADFAPIRTAMDSLLSHGVPG